MARPSHINDRLAAAFWLLTVAWLCANVQPGTVGTLFEWMANARQFSHQQRLAADVAALLGGEKEPVSLARSAPTPKPHPAAPALPETTFKKLEVPLSRTAQRIGVSGRGTVFWIVDPIVIGKERAAPPHAPPRPAHVS